MPDYSKGKIYQIISPDREMYYIGSTATSLSKRFGDHKCGYDKWKTFNKQFNTCYSIFEKYEKENCSIELIEKFPCNDRDDLNKREGEWIKKTNCVNKQVAGRSREEYVNDNRKKINEYRNNRYRNNTNNIKEKVRNYSKNNPERVNEYKRRYVEDNIDKVKESKRKSACKSKFNKVLEELLICFPEIN